ncbi:MAG: hypothetical protein M3437_20525 [Chloroflexota bacterium]|nr:hypothetical protein [Chloroflexota bacterium]MDQ5865022.1 hypothetical protein [Chloroflexota bacterium]
MDKQTQVWNHYLTLRDEIMRADSLNYQIIGIVIAAVAAILNASFNFQDAFARLLALLSVYVVTVPAYSLLRGNRHRIWRISTYISTFLEPELDHVKWESRLDQQAALVRLSTQNKKKPRWIPRTTFITGNELMIIILLNTIATSAMLFLAIPAVAARYTHENVALLTSIFNWSEQEWRAVLLLSLSAAVFIWYLFLAMHMLRQEAKLRRGNSVEQGFLSTWGQIKSKHEEEMLLKAGTGPILDGRLIEPRSSKK